MDCFEAESERSRRTFSDVPRRKRSRMNSVTERTTPEYQAPPSSPAPTPAPAPALTFVGTRLNGLRQDDAGMFGSSTGSCSSPGSSTGSNSVSAPAVAQVMALAPVVTRDSDNNWQISSAM